MKRNKSKRRLREIYKKLNIKKPYKILLIANKKTNKEDFNKIIKEINNNEEKYNFYNLYFFYNYANINSYLSFNINLKYFS